MKKLIVGFSHFVNEMLEPKKVSKPTCKHSIILEDGTCLECGQNPNSSDNEKGGDEPLKK